MIVALQIFTILASRGNVYALGEAYAFGVIWSFAFKGLAMLVLRFKYKGDPTMRIGLLAQEVAEHEPEAVGEIPHFGILAVEHGRATDRDAEIGRRAA